MSSPNVFQSSPSRAMRRECHVIRSSSPDLPPLQEILTQKSTRAPLRSGSRATPIPTDANTSFISAKSLWKSTQLSVETTVTTPSGSSSFDRQAACDDSVQILDLSTAQNVKGKLKPRKNQRQRKKPTVDLTTEPTPASSVHNIERGSDRDGLHKGDAEVFDESEDCFEQKGGSAPIQRKSKTGTMSSHFQSTTKPDPPPKSKKITDEPLQLEAAIARRIEWTPPSMKTVVNLDVESSALKESCSSVTSSCQASKFKNLLQDYTCHQEEPSAITVPQDEDSSFLKKRKLIEMVTTKDANPSITPAPEKSPIKKKAPKRKPRTITALATAAYRVPTQPDPAPPPSSLLNYFPNKGVTLDNSTTDSQHKGKGKAKAKAKKKVSKKKAPPPKPVLLSPTAALAQVAQQDFIFGTSSQLARETSPTVLRDIQAAIRHSTHADDSEFVTPINSDAIEPPDQRPKLWNAAARDAEGDLFDIDVIDLADGSPKLPLPGREGDPFGYFKGDDTSATAGVVDTVGTFGAIDNDPFINLSDILPPPVSDPPQASDEGSPFFSDSELSVSTNIPRQITPLVDSFPTPPVAISEEPIGDSSMEREVQSGPPRPNYERYTDVQLAKMIKSYGFKPIKRRNAMLALLDQCWESKVRMGKAGVHTSATLSAAARVKKSATTVITPKKPRGRPRKNSVNAAEPQEPPPSAQPPSSPPPSLSPKRSRGRPRKDSLSPVKAATSRSTAKSPKKASARSPAKGKKTAASSVVEIPDSNSENELEILSSPLSSPERVFSPSPPPLDLSLGDDTEMSLSTSPTDQQTALFGHITKAITTAPRTTDPQNPSWHEKILLYDPVVLEDLTAWLNSGQLTKVGYDGEVNPAEVKKWCESKSICCLWKATLRGKERKRF